MARLDQTARGVYVVAVTPFTDRGELDLESTDRLVDFYLEAGVAGLTLLGMMGEAPKLTQAESLAFVRRVCARVAGRRPIVVGVSSPGLAPMRELATSAVEAGAAGVMVAPGAASRTDAQILAYFAGVAEALDDIPFVVQDYPLSTGVQCSPAVLIELFRTLPSAVMLKHEDWPGLAKITALRTASAAGTVRRVSILAGNGGLFLTEELERGADGAMTGFAFPEMMIAVCAHHEAGRLERARDLFDAYLPLMRYEQQPGIGLAVRKHLLARRGVIASPRARRPAPLLSREDLGEIQTLLDRQARRLADLG